MNFNPQHSGHGRLFQLLKTTIVRNSCALSLLTVPRLYFLEQVSANGSITSPGELSCFCFEI